MLQPTMNSHLVVLSEVFLSVRLRLVSRYLSKTGNRVKSGVAIPSSIANFVA